MKAYDIVAYTYKAEVLHPSCAVEQLAANAVLGVPFAVTSDPEQALDAFAERMEIDRQDEHTFDSDDFPKVVFASQVEETEYCGECHEVIL